MGEWKRQGETVCMPNTVHCAMAADGEEARFITTTHNADCDAYEARIAALGAMLAAEVAENVRLRTREVGDEVGNLLQEVADLKNELARVKAESLRVVPVGNSGSLAEIQSGECHLFRHVTGGPIYIIDAPVTGASTDSGHAHWCARIEGVVDEWSQYDDGDPVQPVRLERWEANDDNH